MVYISVSNHRNTIEPQGVTFPRLAIVRCLEYQYLVSDIALPVNTKAKDTKNLQDVILLLAHAASPRYALNTLGRILLATSRHQGTTLAQILLASTFTPSLVITLTLKFRTIVYALAI